MRHSNHAHQVAVAASPLGYLVSLFRKIFSILAN